MNVIDRTMRRATAAAGSAILALVVMSVPTIATAGIIYTWTSDGTTEGIAQRGTAVLNFSSANALTITLTDDVVPTQFVASTLSGIVVTFSQAPGGQTLNSVSPTATINCSGTTNPCPPGGGSSPYGWGTSLSGSTMSLGAGFSGGSFGYQPFAIVNSNYVAPGGSGGLSDPASNPLMVGAVTFNITLAGLTSIPDIAGVTFLFGTVPNQQIGVDPPAVAEPQSLAMVGLGLLLIAGLSRRKGHQRARLLG